MDKKRWKTMGAIVIVLIFSVYFSFFHKESCNNFECFQNAMKSCTSNSYLNEEAEASWHYQINGRSGSECVVEVELLQAKKGELSIEDLKGFSMECAYPYGIAAYPEKDLSRCHGRLKEELQNIIIKKLHSYIIDNIGKFDEKLNSV